MNQNQIFTEYWKVLNDIEDYMDDRFRRDRSSIPQFKVTMKKIIPTDPAQCTACSLHEHNSLRAPVVGEGEKRLLIINRGLPKILAEKNEHFTIPEEDSITKWLEAIGLSFKEDCLTAPLLFCPVKDPLHPPVESVHSCFPYIERLIGQTKPKAILVLGQEGGEFFSHINSSPVFTAPHPSDVLIDPSLKRPVWEILKKVKGVVFGV